MEQSNYSEQMTPESMRDLGLSLWESGNREKDQDKRSSGLMLLIDAFKDGDTEAAAWVGLFMYQGILRSGSGDSQETALHILHKAALKGSLTARIHLNRICTERYRNLVESRTGEQQTSGPLVDFDGKKIGIHKTGRLTPIDAVLEYADGINRLTLSLNIIFVDDELPDPERFEVAVMDGIKAWEGNYLVFGGQSLEVVINITTEDRLLDNVYVFAVTDEITDIMQRVSGVIRTKKSEKTIDDLINKKRSLSLIGVRKWKARSGKLIYIASHDGTFRDYEEIRDVAKHEFGHALGLGDLYANPGDQLGGVEKGTFFELDGYYMGGLEYNLVMSDHHGLISNNDIEMVVLAFSEDEMQLYQKHPLMKNEISKALGRGN